MPSVELGTITTDIPGPLHRLPWAGFPWLVVVGLDTVWILDGLEVTLVGSMSEALKPADTGLGHDQLRCGSAPARSMSPEPVRVHWSSAS